MPPELSWLDLTLAGVLLVSAVVGLWRGLVFEVLALAGWMVAWIVAQVYGPALGASLSLGASGSGLQMAAGIGLCFLLVMVLWTLMARLIRALVAATALSWLDRVLGAWFGLLRGLVLLLALVTVVALTPWRQSATWQSSIGAQSLDHLLVVLRPILPESVSRHLGP